VSKLIFKFLAITALFAALLPVRGQDVSEAVVVGSVLDTTASAIQGAEVTLTHLATGAAVEIKTDSRGSYRTPPLRIGEYAISVAADGFKRFVQSGVVLDIGDVRKVDAVLEVGQVSESVNVEAEAPLLQTSDSTVGTVITNSQIEDLPLNGRDYMQLAALSSGTIASGQGVEIGGQAGTQAAFLLDGQDNNNQQISTGHSGQKEVVKPSVDAIQEFKVVTNGYSAEYGRSSSGVISVALKSGSNTLHGTAYEFLRNDLLDAKNLFANVKPPYRRNDFGASLGGPVVRNKLFVFGDIEDEIIRQSSTTVSTLPTAPQRSGLFSSTILDPTVGTPFQGNQIPVTRMDPVALGILGLVPSAQTAAATNNYVYNSPANQDPKHWDFRADDIISDRQSAYFRYSEQIIDNAVTSPLPPLPGLGYYAGGGANVTHSKSFALVHNKVWTPSLLSSIHVGWNDLQWFNTFPTQALTSVGIPGVSTSNPGFSEIAITGYQTLGVSNVPNSDGSQDRQVSGDLSWTKGAHSIKFGVQANWLQTNFLSSQQSSGIFNFNGEYTKNAFADFLLGASSSESLSNWSYLALRTPYTHFFAQDDWKVSRRLTLNIGLRYELSPPPIEKGNTISNFDLDTNPGHPVLVPAGSQGSSWADRALQGVNDHQWAPRFGFAYSLPDNKTVFRGGYGIFYSNIITEGGMQSMEVNPPWNVRIGLQPNSSKPPTLFLDQGFAANALSLTNAANVQLISYDRSNATPMDQQWNLNIQRQLPGGIVLEVGYYGNKLEHMWRQIDGNPAPPEPGTVNLNREFTSTVVPGTSNTITLGSVTRIQKDGYSNYNALQTKLEKRYSKGVTFIASYAWSKTMSLGDSSGVQNPLDWRADYAPSGQDMRQHFVGSAIYALPFGHGKTWGARWNRVTDALLGGWSGGPILTVNTGMPLNLSVVGDPSNTGQQDRPNVVGVWQLANQTVHEWFNTAAFVANAKYTYGNAGRNILLSPGLVNLDFGAHKSFRITERVNAQFRVESFNLTNTPALGAPNTQVGNQLFGQISSAGAARQNQVGLKIIF
jgi:hypothetical protein